MFLLGVLGGGGGFEQKFVSRQEIRKYYYSIDLQGRWQTQSGIWSLEL